MDQNIPVKPLQKHDRLHAGILDLMRFTEGYFDHSYSLGAAVVSQAKRMYDVSHRIAYTQADMTEKHMERYLRRGRLSPENHAHRRTQGDASAVKNQIPSILVIDNSHNHEVAQSLGLELLDSSVIMELDIAQDFVKRGPVAGLEFKSEKLPFSQEFVDIFESAFVDNEGFGYNLHVDTVEGLNVFKELEGMTELAYIAYENGIPVSIVSISIDENAKAYINNVATDPEARGRGISRALLEYAIDDVAARGCTTVGLYTEVGGLEDYYNSIGFESLGIVRNFGASLERQHQPSQNDNLGR